MDNLEGNESDFVTNIDLMHVQSGFGTKMEGDVQNDDNIKEQ